MPDNSQNSVASDLLLGAVAGVAATWVMDRVDWFMYRREPESSRRRTWEVRPEGKDPAHVIASRASQAFGGDPVPQGHPAGMAVHYAIGVVPAAAYGALRERVPAIGAGAGLAYGLAMFIAEDEVANPLLGFAAMPQRYPWQPHARGLVAHLVYGLVTDAVLTGLQRATRGRAGGHPRPGPGHRKMPRTPYTIA
jgi:hypothetical protein